MLLGGPSCQFQNEKQYTLPIQQLPAGLLNFFLRSYSPPKPAQGEKNKIHLKSLLEVNRTESR